MRAISTAPEVVWAILSAGLTDPPAGFPVAGPILLHAGSRLRLDARSAGLIARLAPGGPRRAPPGYLAGIARVRLGSIVSAWRLPEVEHLGSRASFVVDPAALGAHSSAYESAWAAMASDSSTDLCPACGLSCASLCLLAGGRLLDAAALRP